MIQFPMKERIAESEMIINEDGSIFHLHVRPEQLADKVILVGDPGRVDLVASHFSSKECDIQSREFHTITGIYKGKRISCVSTGIGCDNIDIVMNELDALKNVDFQSRMVKDTLTSMEVVRIGTCGGLQSNTPVGSFICSEVSIGLDGLLNFYEGKDRIQDRDLMGSFLRHMSWEGKDLAGQLYAVREDETLSRRIAADDMVRGITIAANGFYGPQGRKIRLWLSDPKQNEKIASFRYGHLMVTNFEMESSALSALSILMGHRSTTCCMVVANRLFKEANVSYKNTIDNLIIEVLDRI